MKLTKFEPCEKCKDSKIKGFVLIDDKASLCECYVKWKRNNMFKIVLDQANIPEKTIDYELRSYQGSQSTSSVRKIKKYIKNYKEKGMNKHVYFYGPNGTQKTTLAFHIGFELLKRGISVLYVSTMDRIIKTLGVFENQLTDEHKDFIQEISSVDLLIIDECFLRKDKMSVTDYQINNVRTFLKERMEVDNKSILFISNVHPTDIEKNGFTKTIQDLIVRNTDQKVLTFLDNYQAVKTHFEIEDLWS